MISVIEAGQVACWVELDFPYHVLRLCQNLCVYQTCKQAEQSAGMQVHTQASFNEIHTIGFTDL